MFDESDAAVYAEKTDRIAIRNADDVMIAIIDIVSPGNKSSWHAIQELVHRAWSAIDQGVNLMLVDLIPPTPDCPQGMHNLIWIWGDPGPASPGDQPLTSVAYAMRPLRAFVEPIAVGNALIDMPLFLDAENYVPVPLEARYQMAWRGVPERWKSVLAA